MENYDMLSVDEVYALFHDKDEQYITAQTIKLVIGNINEIMFIKIPPCDAINEYGDYFVRLDSIDIIYNVGASYKLIPRGRCGDCGWSAELIIHEKCDIKQLVSALKKEFKGVKLDVLEGV